MSTLTILLVIACTSPPDDTNDGDDTGDTGEAPWSGVDLTGAEALVLRAPTARTVLQQEGYLYKILADGTEEPLFPDDFKVGRLQWGEGMMAVHFTGLVGEPLPHWFDGIEGGGLWTGGVAFSIADVTTNPEPELIPLLPPEQIPSCNNPDVWGGNGTCAFWTWDGDNGPDGTVWVIYQRLFGTADLRPVLYAFDAARAVRATPLSIIEGGPVGAVQGGAVLGREGYWLESDGSVSLTQFTDAWAQGVHYGGYLLVSRDDAPVAGVDAATRSVVELPLQFSPEPVYVPTLWKLLEDRLYLVRSGEPTQPEQPPDYRCDPQFQCVALPVGDPFLALLHRQQERIETDDITYVRVSNPDAEDGHFFVHEEAISSDLRNDFANLLDVRMIGGKLHFEAVTPENTGGLYRVDFIDDAFVYTQVEEFTTTVVQTIPLALPE